MPLSLRITCLFGLLLTACSDDSGSLTGAGEPAPTGGTNTPNTTGDTGPATSGGGTDGDSGANTGGSGANTGGSGASTGGFEECAKDRFDSEVGKRAGNIVWVIDTSGSMRAEAEIVQQNLNTFVAQIQAAGLEEARVVVVSEPEFVSVPAPLGTDPEHFLYVDESVGSNEPLEILLENFADYANFLVKDVVTHFVVVTDDDSDLAAQDFVTQMAAQLQGEFRVHAIASPPGAVPAPPGKKEDGCSGAHGDAAAPGVQHYEAAVLTSGLTFSICTSDWSPLFAKLAEEVITSAPLPCDLALPKPSNGAALDPNLVNVVLTPQAATPGAALPRVADASACKGPGWYYDDAQRPTRIVLCQAACDAAAAGGTLEVALGCQTVVQ